MERKGQRLREWYREKMGKMGGGQRKRKREVGVGVPRER